MMTDCFPSVLYRSLNRFINWIVLFPAMAANALAQEVPGTVLRLDRSDTDGVRRWAEHHSIAVPTFRFLLS
jgi:hypothetical protein